MKLNPCVSYMLLLKKKLRNVRRGKFTNMQEDAMRRGFVTQGREAMVILFVLMTFPATAQIPMEFSWVNAPQISPGRYYHTASLLSNGQLLVTGGRRGFEPLRSVRLFDPTLNNGRGSWSDLPDMIDRRERHQATLMNAGWTLISGGLDGVPIKRCELIDPVTQQYMSLPDMNDVRYEHTATRLPGGKVLAVGSKDYDRGLPTCEIFESLEVAQGPDPGWRWRRTGSLNLGRGKHRAVLLDDGRVLVIGGVHRYRPTATCELFNPQTEQWIMAAPMHVQREGHTATLLPDGRVLVTGGDAGGEEVTSCEIFDPYKNNGLGEWTMMSPTIYSRKNHTATLISGRFLVLAGAWRTGQGDRSTELLDTWSALPLWYPGPLMLDDRSNHSATLLNDGRLILVGGELLGYQEATPACDISEKTLDVEEPAAAATMHLLSAAPNPFASQTVITFDYHPGRAVRLVMYDFLGRAVRSIDASSDANGRSIVRWDGCDDNGQPLPAGRYIATALTGSSWTHIVLQLLR
jgi:hypothetical protein